MKNLFTNKRIKNLIFYTLGILVIIVTWSIISVVKNNYLYPNIINILSDEFVLLKDSNTYLILLMTILKLLLVLVISITLSFIFGFLSFKYNWIRKILSPIILFMRSLPVASLIIIILLLIDINTAPFIITLFVSIPITYENFYSSFKNIDNDIINETKMISNISIIIAIKLFIPLNAKLLLSNLLSITGLSLKVLVMGEILSQGNNTIGGKIQFARTSLDITRVFSWTLILLFIVLILELILNIIDNKISKEMEK